MDEQIIFQKDKLMLDDDDETNEIVINHSEKSTKISEIMLCQLILSVVLVVGLVTTNYVKPEITRGVLTEVKQNMDRPFEYKAEVKGIVSEVLKLINVKL